VNTEYPVLEIIPSLKQALQHNPVVILQAPPGAGKSTVLPLQLLEEGWMQEKKMIMLEPRRLAARSVAMRMAQQLGEQAGETIGYRVRFESVLSAHTRVEVVTEGILTRMIQTDNSLQDINLVIFDEFHERSLQADLALALCYQVQQVLRPDLRILIMSATLDGEKISSLFNNAPIVTSIGRQYPITLHYNEPDKNVNVAVNTVRVIKKALREQIGDMLVFLPGAGEIQRVLTFLEEESVGAKIVPLYGDLPFKKQQEAILPDLGGTRKIVLATSIAETSLTIEGITTVVDVGFSRVPRFDPRSGLTRLETVKVTRDAADQRAGRAGRLGPGVCYRMWSQSSHHLLQPSRQPEILEADLANMVLELASWGIQEMNDLTWMTPPPSGAVSQAKELLHSLDALDSNKITVRGKEMLKLPTHPRIAHMMLTAIENTEQVKNKFALALATDLAALLEERDPLSREASVDLGLRIDVLRKWRRGERMNAGRNVLERIEKLAASWRRIVKVQVDNDTVLDADVGKLLLEVYPERIAQQLEKQGLRYKLANGRIVKLPEHDPLLNEKWLAIAQLDAGMSQGKIFLAAPVRERDLESRVKDKELVKWDSEKGMITAQLEQRIGSLVFSSRVIVKINDHDRINILCEALREEGLKLLNWSDLQRDWQARVLSLRVWRPNEEWPDVSDENLLATSEEWLAPYLTHVNKRIDFQRLDLQTVLAGMISWQLSSKLEKLAPLRLQVPSGSFIKLDYFHDGRSPVMEVRLQEMFGLLETPAVNEGRTKILLHLLSPGYKPVQVTQDLKSFWQTTYHDVRKELRMRYPRHHWPEDPWTAEAVRGVKRRHIP
jgi:ATP-dependent helicase HrpB